MLIVVDLPAPFGPRKPNVSPRATSKLTPRTASTSPKDFCRSETSIARFILSHVTLQSMDFSRGTARAQEASRPARRSRATAMDLFGERGYDAVTVADVARAADVSEKTVFNYFPAKEDLVFDERPGAPRGADRRDPHPPARRLARGAVPPADGGAHRPRVELGADPTDRGDPAAGGRQLAAARAAVHRLGARGRGAHAGDRGGDGQRARRPRPGRRRALAGVDAPAGVPRRLQPPDRGRGPARGRRRPARAGAPRLRPARAGLRDYGVR